VLIIGDFNYPDINYITETVKAGDSAPSAKFFHKTQDLCLIQNVVNHTRVRQNQEPSTLDYVFTEEENLIDELTYGAPLGKSDHVTLEWRITMKIKDRDSQQAKLNYWKGNYREITSALQQINWKKSMERRSVNEMWTDFKTTVLDLTAQYVPLKEDRRKRKGKWLSRGTIKKMKDRDKAWRKYRQYSSGTNYETYRTIRNTVNSLIREDEDRERKRILQNFRGKPKSFYGYMRTLQTVKSNVTILRQDNGELTTTDQEAADILANYFKEAFTMEDLSNLPTVVENDLGWRDTDVGLGGGSGSQAEETSSGQVAGSGWNTSPATQGMCISSCRAPVSHICKVL
jgi:hypothetical protein